MDNAQRVDVAILGGGLAGLTLALQLRQADPALAITIFERRSHPAPEAAFKVGESTVEIGAHYFSHVLGLREHLDQEQIRKFGFRFFFSDGRDDIDRCTEIGVSRLLPTPSWQIDRGRFETMLGERAHARGIDFRDGAMVRGVELADGDRDHRVTWSRGDAQGTLDARWVVDASGRAGVLKRKLGLAEANEHDANAVWWRVEGLVDPNDWSDDAAWVGRCTPPDRWRSTNHMCGKGYWFWLIPLASGAHSLGIVCDAVLHPLDTMDSHDKAMDWLRRHQPRVAASLEGHAVMDFRFLRHFSHGCRQVFGDRWALTGEAGLFLDPFYSPGSDFIAISNTYITDLVLRDRAGTQFAPHAALYEQLYVSFYANTMTLYQDQYALFGDEQVMPVKVIWDYTFYWALLAPVYFAGRIADIAMYGRLRGLLERGSALNAGMQSLLREWGVRNDAQATAPASGRVLDQYGIDWFHELNRQLRDEADDAAFDARIAANVARMDALAAEILGRARDVHPEIGDHGLDALLAGDAPPPSLDAVWYAAA
ncbi:tryptophan 7-halogenase [Luteimonas sp. MC1895]|uniref:NAD(P)/FAD-dependent oxidoreductase n=1 Tax=Luteimonas sp. MC1895 TaxID=2819513 RepID=UPI0018F062E8|nr:tryptophan 7-halogenase [Luteimonas sp. MC1895]MBJ6979074.1 tryptophan 7-halogenase [Luteimonas sp. MC1895]